MSREVANFRTFWKSTTFSSVLEPMIYLLAFGLGLGATLVDGVDGLEYVEFVGTGMVATAVIFASAFPAMFGTFVKHRFQNTYDAILAAPVSVEELVTAEMLWIGLRAGFYGSFPLIVADGIRPRSVSGDAARAGVLLHHGARLRRASGSPSRAPSRRSTSSATSPRWSSRRSSWWRARSSRSISSRRAFRCWRTSTRSTSWSSWSATPRSGSRRPTCCVLACWSGFALVMWRVAIRQMTKTLID